MDEEGTAEGDGTFLEVGETVPSAGLGGCGVESLTVIGDLGPDGPGCMVDADMDVAWARVPEGVAGGLADEVEDFEDGFRGQREGVGGRQFEDQAGVGAALGLLDEAGKCRGKAFGSGRAWIDLDEESPEPAHDLFEGGTGGVEGGAGHRVMA